MKNSPITNFVAYIFIAIKYSTIVVFSLVALGVAIIFIIGGVVFAFLLKTFARINRLSDNKINNTHNQNKSHNDKKMKDVVDVEYEIIDDEK